MTGKAGSGILSWEPCSYPGDNWQSGNWQSGSALGRELFWIEEEGPSPRPYGRFILYQRNGDPSHPWLNRFIDFFLTQEDARAKAEQLVPGLLYLAAHEQGTNP